MKDTNQMADTFFDFSTLKNGEHILPPDDEECLENEEEYDAHNDETFGDLEDDLSGDDWEQQHEQFAEFAKSSIKQDKIEDSFRDLVLSDIPHPLPLTGNSVWSYTPPKKNGEVPTVLSSLQKASQSFVQSRLEQQGSFNDLQNVLDKSKSNQTTPKICTVEELEKNLLKSTKNVVNLTPPHLSPVRPAVVYPQQNQHPFPRPVIPPNHQGPHYGPHGTHPHLPQGPLYPPRPPNFQGHPYPTGPNRYPPGMPPINMPPPVRHMPPPVFRMMPPHLFMQGNMPQRPPPGIPFPYTMNHHSGPPHPQRGNMPPLQHGNMNMNSMQHYQQYQRQRTYSGRYEGNNDKNIIRDEYEGLMTAREKQWLLNIQLLQLNTGTPYFDDYYYTVFKERKAKSNKENGQHDLYRYQNNRQRRNSDRQENPLTPKCGSVTAPRKIIDMDVVNCDKDSESTPVSTKDTKKTKQLLLELEQLYSLFLKAEDLTNPVAIHNLKILRDIKQKQRLRELEAASTPEQKQEVLELVKKESEPVVENPHDYMQKILASLLQEDKFTSFMNIRKGKMLLLRILPVATTEQFFSQVVEIWSRLLLSISIIGRRDTAGDNLLPKLYPMFKRYIQSVKMSDILDNIHGLTEVTKLENSRSTPLSHQGKAPLYFVLLNKFGVSAIAALFVRSEFLISTNGATEQQQTAWFNFIQTVADLANQISKIPTPLEGISQTTFHKLCQRIPNLGLDKQVLLSKHFVEVED
ncbi:hypothetical protein HHI36_021947 [Cryptolaemus montrouzieri]|uniref:Uncharacterized protein n=1 Tax=Cryptolaemus montrouzieri TaxID=559131 RepID=A0ABD2MYE6_9CUCU